MTKNFHVKYVKEDVCPVCEDIQKIGVGTRKEVVTIKKEPVGVAAKVEKCTKCGEFFSSSEDDEVAIQQAYGKYRRIHNLLQPTEIREIREKYGLGQRAFARVLGWGEITIHRYEAGSLQDDAHNDALLLVRDADNFAKIYERTRHLLPKRVARRVDGRLANLLAESQEENLHKFLETQFLKSRDDIESGYRRFDLDRFESAILYFCNELQFVFKTKLNKLLWYFDFLTFKRTTRSATGAVYVHFPYGPVPYHYDIFLANLIDERALEPTEMTFDEEKAIAGEWYKALEEPDMTLFDQMELKCLQTVSKVFGPMSAKKISDRSHNEEGYKQTGNNEVISYEWADLVQITDQDN